MVNKASIVILRTIHGGIDGSTKKLVEEIVRLAQRRSTMMFLVSCFFSLANAESQ
jgi:hypothetical protein